jgi:cytochrome P450
MSIYFMHTEPSIFPSPFQFLPDRWLDEYDPLMDRHFVPFSKGSRNCIGLQ